MASLASINIRFTTDLRQFSTQMQNANRDLARMATSMSGVGNTLSIGLTAPILAFGAASVKVFGDIQALNMGLEAVMGNSEAAGKEFEKLREVAKLPGLGLEEAVRGSVSLQSAGFAAGQARDVLLSFGNALATVGKGKNELNLVILALTQLQNKSGGFAQDLRQLTEQLPQLKGALKSAFGTTDSEAIQKMGISGRQLVDTLTKEFAKLPKVSGGIKNAFENISDSVKLSLSAMGDAINRAFDIEGKMMRLGDYIGELAEKFEGLSPVVQKIILVIGGLAASIGPVLLLIGGIVTLVPTVVAGFNAIAAAALFLKASMVEIAVIIASVVTIYQLLKTDVERVTFAQKQQAIQQAQLNKINEQAAEIVSDHLLALDKLIKVARDENKSKREREAAIKAINKISPEYLGNITLETAATEKATAAIDKYSGALLRGAKARAAESVIQELIKQQVKIDIERQIGAQQINALKEKEAAITYENLALEERNKKLLEDKTGVLSKIKQKSDEALQAQIDAAKKIYDDNKAYLALLENIGAALESNAAKAGFKPGTIAYYEDQISALEKLQKEVATTHPVYQRYADDIENIRKKIEAIKNVGPVKVPYVRVTSPEGDEPMKFSLAQWKDVLSYYEKAREQFSKTSAEYQAFAAVINNTKLEIEAIEGLDEVPEKIKETKREVQNLGEVLSDTVRSFFVDVATVIGQTIGNIATGVSNIGDVFKALNGVIGDFLVGLGKAMIEAGIAKLIFDSVLMNPLASIAVGTGLVAFGQAFKNQGQQKFANGGIVGGSSYYGDRILARVNSGELILNQNQQKSLFGQLNQAVSAADVALQLVGGFNVTGDQLQLVLDRSARKRLRTG